MADRGLDAVVLGFLVITTVLVLSQWKIVDLRNVVPTFRQSDQITSLIPGWSAALDQIEHDAQSRQEQNGLALSKTLRTALASGDRNAIESAAAKMASLGSHTSVKRVSSPMQESLRAISRAGRRSRSSARKASTCCGRCCSHGSYSAA